MDPAVLVGLTALAGTVVTAALGYRRGDKADRALNLTTSIQVTQSGMQTLIEQLQGEVTRSREANERCETECREVRAENEALHERLDAMRVALTGTQAVVDEQKRTIGGLERQLANLRGQQP